MPHDIPAVRILPMSDKAHGFIGRSIENVQTRCFLRELPAMNGRWRYQKTGLNADPGTIVLFQFRAHIIASAIFLRDEKALRPRQNHRGGIYFDPRSFKVFDPLNATAMRLIWPRFRGFGHVKQYLNPTSYPSFKRRLRNVISVPQTAPRRHPTQTKRPASKAGSKSG